MPERLAQLVKVAVSAPRHISISEPWHHHRLKFSIPSLAKLHTEAEKKCPWGLSSRENFILLFKDLPLLPPCQYWTMSSLNTINSVNRNVARCWHSHVYKLCQLCEVAVFENVGKTFTAPHGLDFRGFPTQPHRVSSAALGLPLFVSKKTWWVWAAFP